MFFISLLRYFISFFFLSTIYLNVTAFAKLSHPKWQKFTTPHFEILFDEQHKDIALEYAIEAEVVHEILSPYFSERPAQTILKIDSRTDEENAAAMVAPRYFMWVTPKWPSQPRIYYDSWKYTVLIHEYTHVLQMAPGGAWRPFRSLFGNVFHPNQFLPRWYIEGMGIEMESRFSNYGRLNSPFFYAKIRAMVDEGTWGSEDISQINERNIPRWPLNRSYFFGSLLMNEVSNQEGFEKLDLLNIQHSRQYSRLFLNKSPRKLFQKDYQTMLQTAYMRWRFKSEEDLNEIKKFPIKKSQTLPLFNTSENVIERYAPRISPDGKHLIFIQSSVEKKHQIVLLKRQTTDQSFLHSQGKVVAFGDRIQSVQWINNEEFVFDRIKNIRRNNVSRWYNDLYKGHISGRRPYQLTVAQRLQFPSLSWDQTHILAIQSYGDQNTLVQVHPDTKEINVLYAPIQKLRMSYPLPLTENEIVFIAQDSQGVKDLRVWNKKTKQTKVLPGSQKQVLFLSKIRGGLIYNSDVSGISNLYFWDRKNQRSHPITHSKTEIQDGTFDHLHQELWISQLHADGYRLEVQKSHLQPVKLAYINIPHSSEKKPISKLEQQAQQASFCHPYDNFNTAFHFEQNIPANPSLMCLQDSAAKNRNKYLESLREKWRSNFRDHPPSIKKYHGTSYLFPHFWFPWFNAFGVLFRGSDFVPYTTIRGSDPLEHHNYKLRVNYIPSLKTFDGSLNYNYYKQFRFNIYHNAQRAISINEKAIEYNTDIYLFRDYFLNDYWTTSLGGSFRRDAYSEKKNIAYSYGPNIGLRYTAAHPDFFLADSENFYINYSRLFNNRNLPPYNDIQVGVHFVWSFPSPFRFLTQNKQPVFQNSSLRYHKFSLKTDHTFISNKKVFTRVAGSSLFKLEKDRPYHYIRGYSNNTFQGWQIHSLNLEYTLPLFEIQKGLGTGPLFFQGIDITFLSDHLILKGQYLSKKKIIQSDADRLFSSLGIESKLNTTVGYHYPLSVGLGLYYGLDRQVGGLHIGFNAGLEL